MIKESSHYLGAQDRSLDEMTLPSTEDTIGRIATEREARGYEIALPHIAVVLVE